MDILYRYERLFGTNTSTGAIVDQLTQGENIVDRKNMNGHICVDALIFNTEYNKLLVVFHRHLGYYVQPGGHIDDMIDHPLDHCRREIQEEIGIDTIQLHPRHQEHDRLPMYIDTNPVPPRPSKDEGVHIHHNLGYVFIVPEEMPLYDTDDEGVSEAQRMSFDFLEPSVAQKVTCVLQRLEKK